jgi:hypothetical protein
VTKVFISYSHADDRLRKKLDDHLALLKRQGIISTWFDRMIAVGQDIDNSISRELEEADIVLLLVSPDFIKSSYCYDLEMKRAMERHLAGSCRVVPVILHHCDWQGTAFGKLKATPQDGRPINSFRDKNIAFLQVAQDIRAAATPASGPPTASNKISTEYFCYISRDKVDSFLGSNYIEPAGASTCAHIPEMEELVLKDIEYGRPDVVRSSTDLREYAGRLRRVLSGLNKTIRPFSLDESLIETGMVFWAKIEMSVSKIDKQAGIAHLDASNRKRNLRFYCSLDNFSGREMKSGRWRLHSTNYAFFRESLPVVFETVFMVISCDDKNIVASPFFLKIPVMPGLLL